VNLETARLWAGQPSGMTGATNPGEELAQLKFGFPQAVVEPGGLGLRRVLVRGGLHQEHPLASPYDVRPSAHVVSTFRRVAWGLPELA
jgi:hypothetical protein